MVVNEHLVVREFLLLYPPSLPALKFSFMSLIDIYLYRRETSPLDSVSG